MLVSACRLGRRCRWDESVGPLAGANDRAGTLIPVCPEELGGLETPRGRAEIVGGDGDQVLDGAARVLTEAGEDVTESYLQGAIATLAVARAAGATVARLQDFSPSCGASQVSDGTFTRTRRAGAGVTAALLLRHGIAVEPI